MKYVRKLGAGLCIAALTAGVLAAVPFSSRADEPANGLVTVVGIPGNDYADGEARSARFASPLGMGIWDGTLWIADTDNNLLRRYANGKVSTAAGKIAGTDAYGNALGGLYNSGCLEALFNKPVDCLPLPDGRVAVADRENHVIRVASSRNVYTLSGFPMEGYAEGSGGQARFSYPSGLALGKDGSIYVADTGNHCIRRLDDKGYSSLVAGVPGQGGYGDGEAKQALFLEPSAIAVADDGSIYVADTGNQRIRRIYEGQVTTVAGRDDGFYLDTEYRAPGLVDGPGQEARFRFPKGICMADSVVIVADTGNHVIRAISPAGQVRIIAGNGDAGYGDGEPLTARLNSPGDVEWANGTLYIMDSGNSALRSMPFDPKEWLRSVGEGLE